MFITFYKFYATVKSVSMEIEVLKSHEEENDNYEHIDEFKFQGVTLLGEKHPPAVSGANITTNLTQTMQFEEGFKSMVKRVNKIILEEGVRMKREEVLKRFESLSNVEGYEEIVKDTEMSVATLEKKLFSLSVKDLRNRLTDLIVDITVDRKYSWGVEQIRRYYFEDLLPEENIVILEDCSDNHYYTYGFKYSQEGDLLKIDFESGVRYIRGDWRPLQEGEVVEDNTALMLEKEQEIYENKLNSVNEELKDVKSKFTDKASEVETLTKEKVSLEAKVKELEASNEKFEKEKKDEELKAMLGKYEKLSSIAGYSDIVANKYEKSVEDLERDLKVFAYDNGVTIKTKKFETKDSHVHIPIDGGEEVEKDRYNGILNKYMPKDNE